MVRIIPFLLLLSLGVKAQSVPSNYYQDLQYRLIGPFRAGRTVGAVGIPSQPNVFYMGVNNGGVWKTDDFGRTWKPIFDKESTGSVGDIAVSPSQPNVVYVGSGEGLHRPDLATGDGMFKSTDGGNTWKHIGLNDAQQIGRVVVHPTNPEIVFAAVLGHPYGANEMRGVYRTKDGGASWERVLYINHNTGAIQVEFDPTNPEVVFADLWEHREGPWENASFSGTNSGLHKSTDGGTTWRKLTVGLPTAAQGLGRIGFGISNSNPKRIFATVDAREQGGVYRSDDAGESWKLVSTERRVWGRGSDFAEIRVHPKNPDVVYAANTASYRSTDGGITWTSFKGAPGGYDYHRIWINPLQPDIMIFAADQGATITVNGGKTWSSWYNQPTAQLYHVSTDHQFPYWVYGGQQESGAIGTASRGNGGQISFRDWMGAGADEYAYVAPDPKNSDIIYGGRVTRFNKKTGQTQNVAPEALRSGQYRMLRTLPLLFHPADQTMLLFATNVLWKSHSGGDQWEIISPDLTRKQPEVPASIGDFKTESLNTMKQRAVIYSVSGSPLDKNIIWAGTDDGLVHVTLDGGKNWKDVTPALTSWDKISQFDASHFDRKTAFFSVNAFRKDDLRPHVYKTNDGGATWKEIVNGIPANGSVNVVREDPKQKGLLFAGTEREVFFSIDEGENWQSLKKNMPATSIRDLVIHEDDLVIGTHGRSIWILDNISPLRNLANAFAAKNAYLFPPAQATRVRYNMFSDTPLPPEEPAGQNPPDGATIDYWLAANAGVVRIEIAGLDGAVMRVLSSKDQPEPIDTLSIPHPTYWIRPNQSISTQSGHHRIVWDLRHDPPKGADRQFAIAAVYHNTPSGPVGPYFLPGKYKIRLVVDGTILQEQEIHIRLDPRVTFSNDELVLQSVHSMMCYRSYNELLALRNEIDLKLSNPKAKWAKGKKELLIALRGEGRPENPDVMYGSISDTSIEKETIVALQEKLLYLMSVLQSTEAKPTAAQVQAVTKLTIAAIELKKRAEKVK